MKTNALLTMSLALLLLPACGQQEGDEKEKSKSGKSGGPVEDAADADFVEDSEVAGQVALAQIDDAVAGAAEDEEAQSALALTAEADGQGEAKWYRTCNDDGATAIVDIKRSATRHWTWENAARSGETTFNAYHEKRREWSKEGSEIDCGPAKKFAAVPVLDMEGVKLDVTFKHVRSRETTIVGKRGTFSRSFKHAAEGERHFTWTDVSSADGVVTINKEFTGSSTRQLTITNTEGKALNVEGAISTAEADPFKVELKRDATTLVLQSRLIKSGTMIATNKSGGRVETTFADVLYERGQGCIASSGQITGKIYEKDATEPKVTFTIDLSGDTKSIVFSNGNEYEYSPEGCDLDESSAPDEAQDAAEVANPVE